MRNRGRWGWALLGVALAMPAAADEQRVSVARAAAPADLASQREWPEAPKYFLPWPAKITRTVYQGNFGKATHLRDEFNYYAWDFAMELEETVCASRAGTVYSVFDTGADRGDKGNKIEIQHEDGELSVYAHIRTGSAEVKRGDRVQPGQPIAGCGDMKHVHFVLWQKDHRKSMPSGFFEVKEKAGVAVEGRTYTSRAPVMTAKTIAEGAVKLRLAEELIEQKRIPQSLSIVQKLAGCETIRGNDRRRAEDLLGQFRKDADETLATAQVRLEQGEFKDAKARAGEVIKTWPGLPACEQARALLKQIAKRERETKG